MSRPFLIISVALTTFVLLLAFPPAADSRGGGGFRRQEGLMAVMRQYRCDVSAASQSDSEIQYALARVTDSASIADRAKPYVAYALRNGLVRLKDDGTFAPFSSWSDADNVHFSLIIVGNEAPFDSSAFRLPLPAVPTDTKPAAAADTTPPRADTGAAPGRPQ